jgi:hypothetical protein
MKLKAVCNRDHMPAFRQSGSRSTGAIRLLVLHDTEGGTAEGVARYFAGHEAGGSAHLVIDDTSCYRCLEDEVIPWGAPGANTNGFHIEQCGYASWSKARWMLHVRMLRRVAYKLAVHSHKFGIPLRFVTADELRHYGVLGVSGVTTHLAITESGIGGPGGTHTDPGDNYPLGFVLWLAKRYRRGMR